MKELTVQVGPAPIAIESFLTGADGTQGAEVIFTGRVRAENLGRVVSAMSYDAFEPLAVAELTTIAREAAAEWGPRLSVLIQHRTGRLELGEISVLIIIRSPHRAEAYEASRYIIDELKTRVPIWKQEHYPEGDSEWLQGHALCQHSAV